MSVSVNVYNTILFLFVLADERKNINMMEVDRDIRIAFKHYLSKKEKAKAQGAMNGGLQESHVIHYTPDRGRRKESVDDGKIKDRNFLSVQKSESKQASEVIMRNIKLKGREVLWCYAIKRSIYYQCVCFYL